MTSEKKIAANRINARKSRGPRTAAGKDRVSYNAFRHGLAALKHLDPMLSRDIDLIARAMCGDDIDPLLFEQALVIAENEMVLRCVRVERVAMIERLRDIAAAPLVKRDNRTARARDRNGPSFKKSRQRNHQSSSDKLMRSTIERLEVIDLVWLLR